MTAPAEPGARPRPERTSPPPPDHHRNVAGGWLRPAVFGAMDGLVSNVALIAGVAGGGAKASTIALTGFAGLVGGAFSMAAGEYTSVRSQAEAAEREIANERRELHRSPASERAELALAYRNRGLEPDLADEVARQLMRDPDVALREHAQQELGVDPDNLASPWVAATSSLLAFAVGAFVPLLPFLIGSNALLIAFVLSGLALFGTGALVSRFTHRTAVYSGIRQLIIGGLAAAMTYGLGSAVGAGIG